MEVVKQFFSAYSTSLDVLPEDIRLIAAVAIIILLIILFVRFVQKSIAWIIIFILLVPAAWPALHEIGTALWEKVLVPFLK